MFGGEHPLTVDAEGAAVVRPPGRQVSLPLAAPLLVGEQAAWDIFFASVVSIQYHPGNPPDRRLSLAELASIADDMMVYRRARKCR